MVEKMRRGLEQKEDKSVLRILSRTQKIVTKINILLQEIRDMSKHKPDKHAFNGHKNHPKDIDVKNGQDDTHSIYNSTSSHPLPDKPNIPIRRGPDPNHTPDTGDNAFAQQKPNPYELWSALPPESLSSSSSDEDSTDDSAARTEYGLMKTGLPRKRVGMGVGGVGDGGGTGDKGRDGRGTP